MNSFPMEPFHSIFIRETLNLPFHGTTALELHVRLPEQWHIFILRLPFLSSRDIKTSNILLDTNYSAKVSDFGTSRSVPHDKTHLTTIVRGTFGYIDPEYFQSSLFTDRSDVYSFGVVLVELITGRKPILEEDEVQNLIAEFISLMKENSHYNILDPIVVKEARKEDIHATANLAMRCLRLKGKKRPTMKEVSAELEVLRKAQSALEINQDHELTSDGNSLHHTTRKTFQQSREESIWFLQMESTSV